VLNPGLFARFGVLVVPGFLDAGLCRSLLAESRASALTPALVRQRADVFVLDERVRRVRWGDVPAAATATVEERLLALRSRLADHFGVALGPCQTPQFLVYGPGDFYRAHRDRSDDPEAADFVRERRVAAVVFLNGEGPPEEPDSYEGGALTFFGLFADPRLEGRGLPLRGEPGLLVAFDAGLRHAVEPVRRGERGTVVTWFT
jgi:SM-20-related protein